MKHANLAQNNFVILYGNRYKQDLILKTHDNKTQLYLVQECIIHLKSVLHINVLKINQTKIRFVLGFRKSGFKLSESV